MINDAIEFLVSAVIGLFSLALLLRFYFQIVRAPFRNPLSQFICALTDFMVIPARRIVPGLWGTDLATLVPAWLLEIASLYSTLLLRGLESKAAMGSFILGLVLLAAVKLLKMTVYILMVAAIVQAILSWINPYSPIAPLLASLTQPVLRPMQRRLPTVGNVDLSPLVLVVVLQLILMVPIRWLELNVVRLL